MGLGEMGLGELGLGEMGQNPVESFFYFCSLSRHEAVDVVFHCDTHR